MNLNDTCPACGRQTILAHCVRGRPFYVPPFTVSPRRKRLRTDVTTYVCTCGHQWVHIQTVNDPARKAAT